MIDSTERLQRVLHAKRDVIDKAYSDYKWPNNVTITQREVFVAGFLSCEARTKSFMLAVIELSNHLRGCPMKSTCDRFCDCNKCEALAVLHRELVNLEPDLGER